MGRKSLYWLGSSVLLLALAGGLDGAPNRAEGLSEAPGLFLQAQRSRLREDRVEVRAILFGESEETACEQGGDPHFFLGELRDLYICVMWRGLGGTYVEQLTFITPDGNVYQTLTVPFTTPGAPAPNRAVEVEGRQPEVKESRRGMTGETLVLAWLPVAGTFITQHNLAGLWRVEVFLNGRFMRWAPLTLERGG